VPIAHQKATSLDYNAPAQDPLDELLKSRRVLFLKTDDESIYSPLLAGEGSEARLVADLLRRIHRFYGDRFDADRTVGVIVPYRSQIAAIRAELEKLEIAALLDISIDTVERFQGSQRDVIIYSFAVSHVYQLDFLTASTYTDEHGRLIDRKLNVALTRARKQMIMVGNAQILRHNALFRQLIETYS
jgi:superfamily I DNA and/or RNA helicase